MPTQPFIWEHREYLQAMISYMFILFVSFIYLRTISYIVGDREALNLEHMENMGMRKIDYMKALFCWNFLKITLFSFLITTLLKLTLLTHINYWMIFIIYFLFSLNIMFLAAIISCFFINTKKAIVTGLIIFFAL